jgi:hypothetical protein
MVGIQNGTRGQVMIGTSAGARAASRNRMTKLAAGDVASTFEAETLLGPTVPVGAPPALAVQQGKHADEQGAADEIIAHAKPPIRTLEGSLEGRGDRG